METTIERLYKIVDFKEDSIYRLSKEIGVSNGYFSKQKQSNGALSSNIIEKIVSYYSDLDANWLLTGQGEMLKGGSRVPKQDTPIKRNLIPLYNDVATIGGVNSMGASLNPVSQTTEYIDAGDWFPGATAAIRHYGDSMVEYPSGCILALKKVTDQRLLVWGRNYCIETTEYRITKRLNKSKSIDYLVGYSSNIEVYPDGNIIHEPIDIPTETIREIYQVLGCVTKEYSNGIVSVT